MENCNDQNNGCSIRATKGVQGYMKSRLIGHKKVQIYHMLSEARLYTINLERVCHKMSKQRWKQKPGKEMESFFHKVAKQ